MLSKTLFALIPLVSALDPSYTVITTTSCDDTCSEVAYTTGLTVYTTTVHTLVTEYTTLCPLTLTFSNSATSSAEVSILPYPALSSTSAAASSSEPEVSILPYPALSSTSGSSSSEPEVSILPYPALSSTSGSSSSEPELSILPYPALSSTDSAIDTNSTSADSTFSTATIAGALAYATTSGSDLDSDIHATWFSSNGTDTDSYVTATDEETIYSTVTYETGTDAADAAAAATVAAADTTASPVVSVSLAGDNSSIISSSASSPIMSGSGAKLILINSAIVPVIAGFVALL